MYLLSSSLRSVNAAVWFGENPSVLLLFWYCETLQSAKAMTSSRLLTQLSSQRQNVLVRAVRCSHIVIQSQRRSCMYTLIWAFNNLCPLEADVFFFRSLFSIQDHPIASPQQIRYFCFHSFTIIVALFSILIWLLHMASKSVCTFCILVRILLYIDYSNTDKQKKENKQTKRTTQMLDDSEPNHRESVAGLLNDTGE